ncbi:helix-turn-helix domain-containing protein [Mycobacterium sp. NPDC003449]
MQVRTMGDLGALVRSARAARGMTQADLAQQLRTSRDWVVRLEKGHPRLEAQRVLDALRVVGVSLEATAPQTPPSAVRKQRTAPQKRKPARAPSAPVDPLDELFGTGRT